MDTPASGASINMQRFIPQCPPAGVPELRGKSQQVISGIHPRLGDSSCHLKDLRLILPSQQQHPGYFQSPQRLPNVRSQSSLPALSSVILAASAANLHPCFASLLNLSFVSSFLILCSITKKIRAPPQTMEQNILPVFCWCCSQVLGSFPWAVFPSPRSRVLSLTPRKL